MPGRNERKSLHSPYRGLHEVDNEIGIEGIVDVKASLDLIVRSESKEIVAHTSVVIGSTFSQVTLVERVTPSSAGWRDVNGALATSPLTLGGKMPPLRIKLVEKL